MPKDNIVIYPINSNVLAMLIDYKELVEIGLEKEMLESGLYLTGDLDASEETRKVKAFKVIHTGNCEHPQIKDGSVIFVPKDWLLDTVYGFGKEYKIVNIKDISAILAKSK